MKKLIQILIIGLILIIPACNKSEDIIEPDVPENPQATEEDDDDVDGTTGGGGIGG